MSGRLGTAAPAADTDTTVYTVPAGTVATLNIAACNRGAATAKVRVAITPGGAAPTDADWVEYDATIPAAGVLERSALVAGAGEAVIVRDDVGTCTYRVHGFEGAA
jgi:hypothetical protein